MSFLSALKTIGKTLIGIEPTAVTILKLFPPTAGAASLIDSLYHTIQDGIVRAEVASPVGGGKVKQDAVVTDVESALSVTQSALALAGKGLQYDDAKLRTAIDSQVAAINAFANFKDSWKIVDLPK